VSFSGKNLTRQAVTENLNVLDYDTYLTATDLILQNDIPQLFVLFNEILSHGFDGHHFIAGLASHFRDLLVCRDSRTINLLEVGENTKQKYYEQSRKTSPEFLMKGIELANACDLEYKNSRNQRLLVELCLMQLASVTFDGEKKKHESFIIPASNFTQAPVPTPAFTISKEQKEVITNNEYALRDSAPAPQAQIPSVEGGSKESCAPVVETLTKETASEATPTEDTTLTRMKEVQPTSEAFSATASKNEPAASDIQVLEKEPDPVVEPALKLEKKKVSGLSLKSIQKKKELEAQQRGIESEETVERTENFSEVEMQQAWQEFVDLQNEKGEKILASIMETDTPVLKGKIIVLELPNETMKLELERIQYPLMGFLKEKLQNTQISLEIKVNESVAKKYAFTPMEKYEKLREKNPMIDKLRTTFDLDI